MLLITAFLFVVLAIVGSAYLAGSGQTDGRTMRTLTVYTTLPAEHAAQIAAGYAERQQVRVNFVPLAAEDLIARVEQKKAPEASLVLADEATLARLSADGYFVPHISEAADAVPENFKQQDGCYTGVWYDPVVFAVNADYLKGLSDVPDTWEKLAALTDVRIGMTDLVAADAASNLLYSLIAEFGEEKAYGILRALHPKVVQYTKYLSNPVRQAGMGEADISVAVASETLRYIADGYPLRIVYPVDGTAYQLTGAGVLAAASAADQQAAGDFLDWLLSDEAQLALRGQGFYFLTTNPATLTYQTFAGKNLVLFTNPPNFTPAQKKEFLDRWVKYIRFSS